MIKTIRPYFRKHSLVKFTVIFPGRKRIMKKNTEFDCLLKCLLFIFPLLLERLNYVSVSCFTSRKGIFCAVLKLTFIIKFEIVWRYRPSCFSTEWNLFKTKKFLHCSFRFLNFDWTTPFFIFNSFHQ